MYVYTCIAYLSSIYIYIYIYIYTVRVANVLWCKHVHKSFRFLGVYLLAGVLRQLEASTIPSNTWLTIVCVTFDVGMQFTTFTIVPVGENLKTFAFVAISV